MAPVQPDPQRELGAVAHGGQGKSADAPCLPDIIVYNVAGRHNGYAEGVNVHVRGVDEEVWKQMRIQALKEDRPVGDLVNEALRAYLEAATKTEAR